MTAKDHFIDRLRFLAIALVLLPASFAQAAPDEKNPIANVKIELLDGKEIRLSQFAGKKYVYLKFWASYCEECIRQMPHLQKTYSDYHEDVEVIAVNLGIDDDKKSVSAIKRKFKLTLPIAVDKSGELAKAVNLIATPLHVLIDKQGNVVYKKYVNTDGIDQRLAFIKNGKSIVADKVTIEKQESSIDMGHYKEKPTALFFVATWCDWYLATSRPDASKNCVSSQKIVNRLQSEYPQINWLGIATRLWSAESDVADYRKKFSVAFPVAIDASNEITFSYQVKNYPTLILLKEGKEIYRSTRIDYAEAKKALAQLVPP